MLARACVCVASLVHGACVRRVCMFICMYVLCTRCVVCCCCLCAWFVVLLFVCVGVCACFCMNAAVCIYRGDYYPASRSEFESIKAQLEYEKVDGMSFHDLEPDHRALLIKQRMKSYCQKVRVFNY